MRLQLGDRGGRGGYSWIGMVTAAEIIESARILGTGNSVVRRREKNRTNMIAGMAGHKDLRPRRTLENVAPPERRVSVEVSRLLYTSHEMRLRRETG